MNPGAILTLLSDLYSQVMVLTEENKQLKEKLQKKVDEND